MNENLFQKAGREKSPTLLFPPGWLLLSACKLWARSVLMSLDVLLTAPYGNLAFLPHTQLQIFSPTDSNSYSAFRTFSGIHTQCPQTAEICWNNTPEIKFFNLVICQKQEIRMISEFWANFASIPFLTPFFSCYQSPSENQHKPQLQL